MRHADSIICSLLQRWLHQLPDMHAMHYGHALQRPRSVSDVGRCQDRMHVYLLDGVHWSDVQRLRRQLHQLPDMHAVYYGRALQRPRRVCDVGRCQHRMHVYLLDGVHWSDVQHMCQWLHQLPHMHAVHDGLQRARLHRGPQLWQHRMHVYLLDGVHWADL